METPGREPGSSSCSEGMKVHSLCKFSPLQPSCRTHFIFRLELWQRKDRQNDGHTERKWPSRCTDWGSAQGYPWAGLRTAGARLSHLPCPKRSNPTRNFTHPMAKGSLCPVLPHATASEYHSPNISGDSLRSPQPGVVL